MSESWSHLTENPRSTTPGFLGEIYTGEMYQIKSEPSYGPNHQPSTSTVESAVSAAEAEAQSDQKHPREYLPGESWWAHCIRTTSRCTIWVIIGVFLLCIALATVLILLVTNVIYVPPRGDYYAPSGVIDDPNKPIRPLMYVALMKQNQISTGVLPTDTVTILPLPTDVSPTGTVTILPLPTDVLPTGTVTILPLPTGNSDSIASDPVTVRKHGFVTRVRPSPTQH
ncbi:hypothetical protein N7540_006976 [Penicillium herquei]|nr:hypothetical protein N7540_006976 [Penicillium herquei]